LPNKNESGTVPNPKKFALACVNTRINMNAKREKKRISFSDHMIDG
jgi:hypothetical protein